MSFQLGTNFPSESGHTTPTESLFLLRKVRRFDCLTSLAGYTTILGYGYYVMLIPMAQYSCFVQVL